MDVSALLHQEYEFFESAAQCEAFASFLVEPQIAMQRWDYSDAMHACLIVARSETQLIVFCSTGFGPGCPWSVQALNTSELGMDGMWSAYLYECVVGTSIWPAVPPDFMLMGAGERRPSTWLRER